MKNHVIESLPTHLDSIPQNGITNGAVFNSTAITHRHVRADSTIRNRCTLADIAGSNNLYAREIHRGRIVVTLKYMGIGFEKRFGKATVQPLLYWSSLKTTTFFECNTV